MRTSHSSMRTPSQSSPLSPVKGNPSFPHLGPWPIYLPSVMLYASDDPQNQSQPIDSNAYQPFKLLDSTVVSKISHELDNLSQEDSEGSHGLYSINFFCLLINAQPHPRSSAPWQKPCVVCFLLFPCYCSLLNSPFRYQSDIYRLFLYNTQPCRWP